ncbi:MAG: DegT/DnrJ/EryC1/StrS family aminotransferase [bacterium]|nr:DegT/DnrJ/EryC1/StrS family aminotransferase [bacterium]
MSTSILAINGGKPVIQKPLPRVYNIGREEIKAVTDLMKAGPLSDYVGASGEYFLGGKEVKKLEKSFCRKFKVKHAVSFNSATTALHAAVAALGIGPGDEVIVPPLSMSATATVVIMNGAVPIFADVDERSFCIDPKSVAKKITKRTKAIIAVNLFGGPADLNALTKLAKANGIKIIEDNAQSPGGIYQGKFTGTVGDIGVFSFNVHKVMQSGEGGILVTDNDEYCYRAQLARNHGENIVSDQMDFVAGPIMGSNYRMTEIEAAIANQQLRKLDFFNRERLKLTDYLTKKLSNIAGLELPVVAPGDRHVFYVYPIKINAAKLGVSRDLFVDAMKAEGFVMSKGYVRPLYLLPIFQNKQVFNKTKFPFVWSGYAGEADYSPGICPVAERLYKEELTFTGICQYPYDKSVIDLFVKAVKKIVDNIHELKQ